MKTIVAAIALTIALAMSLNAAFATNMCNYRMVVEEFTAECKCETKFYHRCGGSGILKLSYECADTGGDCGESGECWPIGENLGPWLLAEAIPACGSTDPLAPYCDEDLDCWLSSWIVLKEVAEPVCACTR